MYKINRKRLVKTFVDLAKIPSPSWKEAEVADYIIKTLRPLRVECKLYPCGESHNLLARIDGDNSRKPVLFSCHMDTVTPCENVSPVVTDKKITSDGTTVLGADDKSAIAVFLEAVRVIRENKIQHGPIEMLFSCAEEIGLNGAKEFDLSVLKARRAFIFDSEGDIGRIILKSPTQFTMNITIKGRAAHAGIAPEKGINSIRVSSEIISRIPNGRIDEETTVNVGVISGGQASNIVPEETSFELEVRSMNVKKLKGIVSEIEKTIRAVSKEYKAKPVIGKRLEYWGFSISRESAIVKVIDKAVRKIGITPVYEASGGGSDTNIINRAGIRAVNLSIGMRKVHTRDEFILIDDLVDGARLILSIVDTV